MTGKHLPSLPLFLTLTILIFFISEILTSVTETHELVVRVSRLPFPGSSDQAFLRIPPDISELAPEIYNMELLKLHGALRTAAFLILPGGAVFAKLGAAINSPPLFTRTAEAHTDYSVDRGATGHFQGAAHTTDFVLFPKEETKRSAIHLDR
jgi:hypothetical protein